MSARPSLLQRAAVALVDDVARIVQRLFLGVKCEHCGDYRRGPRTLERHVYVDHGDLP